MSGPVSTHRKVSCSPAKLASSASSVVALERTATGVTPSVSSASAARIACSTSAGIDSSITRRRSSSLSLVAAPRSFGASASTLARTGARASIASRKVSNALVVTTNPGGTAMPAWVSSPSEPPLPPTVGRSAMPTSLNQATDGVTAGVLRQAQDERSWVSEISQFVLSLSKHAAQRWRTSRVLEHRLILEDRHDPAPAVDADALAVLDLGGGAAGADHRGQAVLAGDDGHVAHRPADVRHRGADLLEDRAPGRIGHLAHEDVALLDAADLGDRLDHPRRAFDHPVAGGEALELVGVGVGAFVEPGIEVLAGDAPQHNDRGVVDHVGHRAERGRGGVLAPFLYRRLALGDDGRPVRRPAR